MWLRSWIIFSVIISAALIVLFVGFLANASLPFFADYGLSPIIGSEWYPYEDLYGFLPALLGSAWAILIALAIALPCGLATAIVSVELLPQRYQSAVNLCIDILAGIPSVVYGLLGIALLLPWLESNLDLLSGHSLLAAGLLLSVMILPTITRLSQDALHDIDISYREAANNLGLNWSQQLISVLLPQAWPSIRSASLLATGRGLGETIAVMLVVGSIDRIPEPWYNLLAPAQTITSRIGREMGEASVGSSQWSALMACGLVLTLAVTLLSLIAHTPHKRMAHG
ncbi:MAG: phosphate ABC transporter permease subunit PstC [Gammaproteobacteria bacterium]|nr:phosphate ABC transporter permease subunit PstC [Gammaproteobacteria bacterium]